MAFLKKDIQEQDKPFVRRTKILCLHIFLLVVAVLAMIFLIFRFPEVKTAVMNVERYIRGVIYGLVIAYLVAPLCDRIEKLCNHFLGKYKHGNSISNWIGIIVGVLIAVCLVAALFVLILPGLIDSITKLVSSLPEYTKIAQKWITETIKNHPDMAETVNTLISKTVDYFENWVEESLEGVAVSVVNYVTNSVIDVIKFIANVFIGLVVAVYVLHDRPKIINQLKKVTYTLFSGERADEILDTIRQGDQIFGGFIHGKLVDSLIVGILCFIGASIMKLPYALLVSVFVGVTNIIPFFGPFIGAAPSALLILMVSPMKCLEFIIFVVVLQQLDGNIIGPRILGQRTGLNEFWVTFALLFFGGLLGFFGMLIGVPLFALIYYVMARMASRRLKSKGLPTETVDYSGVRSYTELIKEPAQDGIGASPDASKPKGVEPETSRLNKAADSEKKEGNEK